MQAQESNSSRGIGGGCRRVLKGLASRRQRAQRSWWLLGIEEATAFGVVETRDHSVTDFLGKAEIAQVACRLVSIETSGGSVSVIFQYAGNRSIGCGGIGISDHVRQAAFFAPALRQDPIERAEREAAREVDLQGLSGLEIRGDAERVPADVNCLVYVGCGALQARGIHFLLGRGQQRGNFLRAFSQPAGNFFYLGAHIQHVLGMVVMHFANLANVIVHGGDFEFFFA